MTSTQLEAALTALWPGHEAADAAMEDVRTDVLAHLTGGTVPMADTRQSFRRHTRRHGKGRA